jgi:hypothetical protein
LKHVTRGPVFERDERESSGTHRARDYAAELSLAADLTASGLPAMLPDDGDVSLPVGGTLVIAECKRPRSLENIPEKVEEAGAQIHRRAVASGLHQRAFGLTAIKVTRALYPEREIVPATSMEAAQIEVEQKVRNVADRFPVLWTGTRVGPATHAVMLRLRLLVNSPDIDWAVSSFDLVLDTPSTHHQAETFQTLLATLAAHVGWRPMT